MMKRAEREALIEKLTGEKIDCVELRKNWFHYYGESGRLIAKYNANTGVLKTF